ncbi:MAG: hypothetical protein Q7V63_03450 [Gammaproteobacteria bacterium]|nr:hypothetical protein [Gammaproteobacteria bacterium]
MLKNSRTQANLAMIEFAARKLGELTEELVFLGGCTTALLINDPAAPDIRTTLDVDCIVDVLSLGQYHQLEKKMNTLGFKRLLGDNIICRWRYDDLILDVMPTNEKILGFGNPWYKEAIKHSITHQIAEDLFIKSVTAPYFLATKFEAFKDRGNGDYLTSHDFEDIIAVIDGRLDLIEEIKTSDAKLKEYLKQMFLKLLADNNFSAVLPGHLNYGPSSQARANMVLKRMEQMVDNISE